MFPTNPLAAAEHGLLFRDDWIAIVRLRPYRVDWRKPNGEWLYGAALPAYAPRAPMLRDKCAAISQLAGSVFACEPAAFYVVHTDADDLKAIRKHAVSW